MIRIRSLAAASSLMLVILALMVACAATQARDLPPPEYETPSLPPFPADPAVPENAGTGGSGAALGPGGAPAFT
jgi:hypothetical protein